MQSNREPNDCNTNSAWIGSGYSAYDCHAVLDRTLKQEEKEYGVMDFKWLTWQTKQPIARSR